LENLYNTPSHEVAGTIANTAIIPIIFMVLAEIGIGTIYDIYGRKKPMVFTYICSTIGTLITPLGSSIWWFQVSRIFVCVLNVTAMLPFIPDLLMEESHALANAFRVISALFGSLAATMIVGISSK
jgi:MFS family permease